jgi:hypothetical protein
MKAVSSSVSSAASRFFQAFLKQRIIAESPVAGADVIRACENRKTQLPSASRMSRSPTVLQREFQRVPQIGML